LKNKSKILGLILIGIIVAGCLSACGNEGGSDGQQTPTGDSQAVDDVNNGDNLDNTDGDGTDTAVDPRQANLALYSYPDVNYDGYDFRLMIRGQQDEWDSQDIISEEETGEPVNDAVFRRNIEVEEALGITITGIWVEVGNQFNTLRRSVAAGDSPYDAVMLNFQDSSNATKQGMLVNLKDTPGVDLSMPWWDQNLIGETSIMNKTYYATGGVSIMTNDGTWTMMFNKQMMQDFDLPNIYDIVKSGEWTADKMLELGKGVPGDLDGDGEIGQFDRVAFTTTMDSVQGLFYSTGNRIVTKDVLDMPANALFGDALMANLEKIYEVMRGAEDFTMISGDYGNHLVAQSAFEENRSLFYAEVMQCVIRLRQMDTEFGIIPMPKANAAQEKYLTTIHAWASAAIAIPIGGDDDERSSTIIEALAYGGYKYITPAYYDIALKTKHARDEESSEMLDIIFAGRTADLGYMDGYGNVISSLHTNINSRNPAFASTLERLADRLQNDIVKAIERYEALD
jgi:hypothetical protein